MWVAIAFILLALAMAVGPIMMMQPTPKQREKAKLRRIAAQEKMRVQLSKSLSDVKPETIPVYSIVIGDRRGRPLDAQWAIARKKFSHGLHFSGEWDWCDPPKQFNLDNDWFKAYLSSLPDSVMAIRFSRNGLYFYWTEKLVEGISIEESLKQFRALMDELGDHLKVAFSVWKN